MQKTQAAPKVLQDPRDGSILIAPAGGRAEAHFRCANPGNPNVAFFSLRLEGLPEANWAESGERGVAPEGEEMLVLALTPPYEAAEGDYDFHVQMLMDGAALGPAITMTLQVEGFLTPPDPDHAVVEQEAARQAEEARKAEEARRLEQERQRQEEQRREEERLRQEESARQQQQQDTQLSRSNQEQAELERQRQDQERARQELARQEEERRKQEEARRQEEERKRQEAANLRLEDLTHKERGLPELDALPVEEAPPPNVLEDPKDGSVLALRPGETLLVKFPITNEATTTTTYIIDHDHTPLVEEWIELSPDQINLPRNGKGELGFRITPPLSARPGEYSFAVLFGRVGAAQTTRGLILSVLPTPAVKLFTATPQVKVGPFARPVDFELKVTGDGNSDTAFRIAAKEPPVASGSAARVGPDELYETTHWRYLFNKEVDNVGVEERSPNPRQAAIQFRVLRKGTWWFGFKEKHKVRVEAVPVTDPTNCGKKANVVELTALRWRLTPFPAVVMLPLLFLLYLLLAGGASDLRVTNPTYQDPKTNKYYIVTSNEDESVPENERKKWKCALEWEASPWNLLRLRGGVKGAKSTSSSLQFGDGTYTDLVRMGEQSWVEYEYVINRFWGGGNGHPVDIMLVRAEKGRKLKLTAQVGNSETVLTPDKGVVELRVPRQGTVHLKMTNVSQPADLEVQYLLVKDLSSTSPFKFNFALQGIGSINPQGYKPIALEMNKNNATEYSSSSDNEFILITTSADLPLLKVKLVPGQ